MHMGDRGHDTRDRFIRAGWELIDEVGLLDALRAVTVSDIAARASRSERSFWNHFEDWDAFVEVLVSNIPRRGPMHSEDGYSAVDVVDETLVAATREVLPELVRAAAEGNWNEVTRPAELTAFRRQLLLASRATDENSLREVLGRDYYGVFLPNLQRIYEQTAAAARVRPVAPLDFERFTRALAAVSEGLLLQHLADPEGISVEFVSDVTAAVALSLLRTEESGEDLEHLEADIAVQPGPLDGEGDLVQLARRCRPVIESRGRLRRWSEAAEAAGMRETPLRQRFQRLEVIGALCFVDHLPIAAARRTPLDWLCQLVRDARADPWCASCLLRERIGEAPDSNTIRTLVALGDGLAELTGERPASVHERVVNVALAGALSDSTSSPVDSAYAAASIHPQLRDNGFDLQEQN